MDAIQINTDELVLRPSGINGFYGCAFQWGKQHLEGRRSIPSTRASIGTAVHAAAEAGWSESILKNEKIMNTGMMYDAAVEALKKEEEHGLEYDTEAGESQNQAVKEIMDGTDSFISDIVPFAPIPLAVEERFTVHIKHALVKSISGTLDYRTHDSISDLKTSKRKPVPASHVVQQSIYKWLVKSNGHEVKFNTIQAVVFKKAGAEGMILPMETNIPYAKDLTNGILDTLDLVLKDIAPIETILRPNPSYMFCSAKFCNFYGKCPATVNK